MAAKSAHNWVLQNKAQLRAEQLPQPVYALLTSMQAHQQKLGFT